MTSKTLSDQTVTRKSTKKGEVKLTNDTIEKKKSGDIVPNPTPKNSPNQPVSKDIPQKDKPQTSTLFSRLSYTATRCDQIKSTTKNLDQMIAVQQSARTAVINMCSPEHQKNICATNVNEDSDCAKAGDTCYLPDVNGGTVLTCDEVIICG